jgi:hypothetical protein
LEFTQQVSTFVPMQAEEADPSTSLRFGRDDAFYAANYRFRRLKPSLLAGMFRLGIRFWKIGVGILQHFVLVAVAQLATEGTVLGALLAKGVWSVAFYCALAHSFVWTSCCGVGHAVLLDLKGK